ncbi:hypothetical protein I4U23_010515 [Adineta vaga]|nr:hypothetical protein I4U23_010515 [Adineta vaga]
MNLFLIVLSLILFNGNLIFGANDDELEAIDVLATLKSSSPTCDLHFFVKNENDFKALNSDLAKLCPASGSKKQCRILCNMVAYELKKACKLDEKLRPSKVIYTNKMTAQEICNLKNIQLTNQWIFKAITNNEEKQIGVTAKDLCTKVTSDEDALPLARFFYKAATRVRQSELSKTATNDAKSNSSKQTLGESVSNAVKEAKDAVVDAATALKDKTKEALTGAKDKVDETVEAAKDKAKDIKDKTSDVVDDAKDKLVAGGKSLSKKINETAKNVRDKVAETGDNIGEKTKEAVSSGKSKTVQALDKARDEAGAAADAMKERLSGEGEAAKDKADDDDDKVKTKTDDNNDDDDDTAAADKKKSRTNTDDDNDNDKVDEGTNDGKKKNEGIIDGGKKVLSNIGNATKEGLKKAKELGEKIVNATVDAVKPADGKDQKVLDVKPVKKPEPNDDDDDDDEEKKDVNDNTNNKPKDGEQNKQIGKPAEPKAKKPTDTNKDKVQDPDDDDEGEEKVSDDGARNQLNEQNKKDSKISPNTQDKTGLNKDGDEIEFKKTADTKDSRNQQPKGDASKIKTRPKLTPSRKYSGDDGWSGNFITYFLLFTLFVVVGYLVLHNKNKVLGLLIEGCRRNRSSHGRRNGSSSSSTRYQRLSQSS